MLGTGRGRRKDGLQNKNLALSRAEKHIKFGGKGGGVRFSRGPCPIPGKGKLIIFCAYIT